jgi:hypothetical protein
VRSTGTVRGDFSVIQLGEIFVDRVQPEGLLKALSTKITLVEASHFSGGNAATRWIARFFQERFNKRLSR